MRTLLQRHVPLVVLLLFACTSSEPVGPVHSADFRSSMQTEGSADGVWIVLFSSDVGQPEAVAERMARDHGSRVRRIYRHGVTGFSASLAPQAVEALRRNPQVALIGPNVEVAPLDHSTQLN